MRGMVLLGSLVCATSAARADGVHVQRTDGPRVAHADQGMPVEPSTVPTRFRYMTMTRDDCEAELSARSIAFVREEAKGVLAPIRLKGPLRGVEFRTNEKAESRETSVWEIADCRLVLAMDDFAAILVEHDIVEVRHYSMYRRAPKRWPDGKIGTRHHGGLALDAARFIKQDGTVLDVLDDFKGKRHRKVCGDKAPKGKTEAARELREIICAAVDRGMFSVILTPNFNRGHRNHFHLEVTPGVKWLLLR